MLAGGVVGALQAIRTGYAHSVRRLMRGQPAAAHARPINEPAAAGPNLLSVSRLPTDLAPELAAMFRRLSQFRSRRMRMIAGSLLFVGLLQGLVTLTIIEPGRVRLRGVIVTTLLYSAPALLGWALARTVRQGRPSELGVWAGLCLGLISGAGFLVSVQSLGSVRILTATIAFAASVAVSYVLLVAFAFVFRATQRIGRLSSDGMAAALSCLAAGTGWTTLVLQQTGGAAWLYLVIALAFPVVLIVHTSVAVSSDATDAQSRAPRLLLLRTFGHTRRSDRLLRSIGRWWLELGPIDLVAGPDLATSVVTIDKLYAWLTGRLRKSFIVDAADLAHRSRREAQRFRDGSHPVVEFSCLESGWRDTVAALARRADAVIMDLRGFTAQNSGCVFEIQTLSTTVDPGRVVFLVDATTQLRALDQVLAQSLPAFGGANVHPGSGPRIFDALDDDWSTGRGVVAVALASLPPLVSVPARRSAAIRPAATSD